MKHVGYFVVGEGIGFGVYEYGRCFLTLEEAENIGMSYWKNRGYEVVEVWVKEQ